MKTPHLRTDPRMDRIAAALAHEPPERIRGLLVKSAQVHLRLTPTEKAEIQLAASRCRRTVTDYLLAAHRTVSEVLASTA